METGIIVSLVVRLDHQLDLHRTINLARDRIASMNWIDHERTC
jgi:hypothetical protein